MYIYMNVIHDYTILYMYIYNMCVRVYCMYIYIYIYHTMYIYNDI